MLVRLDAADRLAREVEARGAVPLDEAARVLLALSSGPLAPARAVVERAVLDDSRLELCEGAVRLASSPLAHVPLDQARFCVADVETTALSAASGTIAEIGAVLVGGTGVDGGELEILECASGPAEAVWRLFRFGRGAVLAGHNLGFDVRFLEQVSAASTGRRIATPVVDTLVLARRLLRGRVESFALASLAEFIGTSEIPCHRALPDARATAEVLVFLLDRARELGARVIGDVCALARPGRRETLPLAAPHFRSTI